MTTAKQRRGKKAADAADAANNPKLQEQLAKAEAICAQAKYRTEELHKQWRAHIFRLSILVLLVSFHQSQVPMQECMKAIKTANLERDDKISGMEAAVLVVKDSVCEILGIVMMATLARFLLQPGNFTSPFYLTATAVLPLQLASYYNRPDFGCLDDAIETKEEDAPERNFPVTLIFHSIVTAACYFMERQMQGRDRDMESVTKLKEDLTKAQKANKKKS